MFKKNRIGARYGFALTLALVLGLAPSVLAVQKESKKKKKEATPQGTPVIWRDPGDVSALNLMEGPGGADMKPDASDVTYLKDEMGGYSPKFRVRDGAGKIWVAKLGKEAQPETAVVRLAWAAGFVTEVASHLVPCVTIKGAPEPRKKVERCGEDGKGFANVRFEARPENVKRLENWSWKDNPFAGTREFKGLIALMGLVNNWDLKDANNKILYVPGENGAGELHYIISDLGATLGKTGNFITHNRNEPGDFVKSKFVEGVEGDRVRFDYNGKNKGLFEQITVEDARWLGVLLSKLSDEQIKDAFRAANFSSEETEMLAGEVRSRIDELVKLGGPAEGVVVGSPQSSPEMR